MLAGAEAGIALVAVDVRIELSNESVKISEQFIIRVSVEEIFLRHGDLTIYKHSELSTYTHGQLGKN